MKNFTAVLLLLVTTFALGQGREAWVNYVSQKGGFTVLLPASPTDNLGKVSVARAEGRPYSLQIMYSNPKDAQERTGLDAYLLGVQDGTLSRDSGKLIKERKFDWGGLPAREFTYSTMQGKVRCQLLVAQGRLYRLSLNTSSDKTLQSKASDTFFKSFKLTVK